MGIWKINIMDKEITNILARLTKLEKAVFKTGVKTETKPKDKNFSGTKGGVLFLISKGYFNQRRLATDAKAELAKNEYHYSIQVVQTALNRLSKGNGALVAMKEGGKKMYVKRK